MKYIKNHKNGIEERAKKYYGTTEVYEFAGYLLEDGSMLNFSYEGYQRDEDHWNIGIFFAKAQQTEAMLKFMRRGNIRCMCNRSGYRFDFIVRPTKAQFLIMQKAYRMMRQENYFVEFLIEKDTKKGYREKTFYNIGDLLAYYDKNVCY